jgi:hypothetical protein
VAADASRPDPAAGARQEGRAFPPDQFARVREKLADTFGGVTAYLHAPAEGVWKDERQGETDREEVVVVEVMADALDREWWRRFREDLSRQFRQEELVVRALPLERL